MNFVTKCCNEEVITKSGREYPDGSRFYISTSVDICSKCLEERPQMIPACDWCGEGSKLLLHVEHDYLCPTCVKDRESEKEGAA